MREFYSRTIKVIGEEAFVRLQNAKVIVFGIGGVGGHAIEALARGGIGSLTIVDKDCIEESNLNRQIVSAIDLIGSPKADAMKERLAKIAPDCRVTAIEAFFLPENSSQFHLEKYDYIVDAIDNVTAKLELAAIADSEHIPMISCMGTGNKMDPTRFEVSDIKDTSVCPLARVMRLECKKRGISKLKVVYSKEQPFNVKDRTPGSVSFVPGVAGMIMAGEVIKDIIT